MFAKVTYEDYASFHPKNPDGVCCHKSKLKKMARAYIKAESFDKETLKQCQELYTLNESELEHLNRKKQFALFCTFVKSQPEREALLGRVEHFAVIQKTRDNSQNIENFKVTYKDEK